MLRRILARLGILAVLAAAIVLIAFVTRSEDSTFMVVGDFIAVIAVALALR